MKEKFKKRILIFLIFILLIHIIFPYNCYAEDFGLGDLNDYKGTTGDSEYLAEKVGNILGIIQVVGTILSVIMLIIIGIKYMIGSVEEKAQYKETLKPYIIGAFILFTGTLLPQIIYEFSQNLYNN